MLALAFVVGDFDHDVMIDSFVSHGCSGSCKKIGGSTS